MPFRKPKVTKQTQHLKNTVMVYILANPRTRTHIRVLLAPWTTLEPI